MAIRYINPNHPNAVSPLPGTGTSESAPWGSFPVELDWQYVGDEFRIANGTELEGTVIKAHSTTFTNYVPAAVNPSVVLPQIHNTTRPSGGKYYGLELLRGSVTISNIHFNDCLNGGVIVYHTTDVNNPDKNLDNLTVADCLFSGNGTGIECRSSFGTFTNNTFADGVMIVNTVGGSGDDVGALGIILATSVVSNVEYPISNFDIVGNTFLNLIALSEDFTHDGGAVEIFGDVTGVNFIKNLCTYMKGFFEIGGHSAAIPGTLRNSTIAFNIVDDYYGIVMYVNDLAGAFAGDVVNVVVENNTFYDRGGAYTFGGENESARSPFWFAGGQDPTEVTLRNNIFCIRAKIGNADTMVREHNLWFDLDGGAVVGPDGSTALSGGTNEIYNQNPLFTNAGAADFTLTSISPAIGAGDNTTSQTWLTDYNGDSISDPIDIGAEAYISVLAPVADFDLTFVGDLTISVTDNSTGSIDTWAWDWTNDGVTDSTSSAPADHQYASAGTYTVKLTVTGSGGTSNTTRQITVYAIPTAAFSVVASAPLTASVTNSSTGTITSYDWDWTNDGANDDTGQNPGTHVYASGGTYTIKLTVTGPGGSDSATQQVTVVDVAAPTALFTATAIAPLTVQLINTSSGSITSYAWDFDDDEVTDSTVANPGSYVYADSGTYTISLTVTGPGGSDTYTQQVTVAGQSSSGIQSPISGLQLWVDVYDATGKRIGQPVINIMNASVTRKLDGAGTIQFTTPAGDERALTLLNNKRRVEIWVQPPGKSKMLFGAGIIERRQYAETAGGKTRTYTGTDMVAELASRSTWFGRKYSQQSVETVVDDLIGLVPGWSVSYESSTVRNLLLEARFDSATVLKALQSSVQQHGLHMRLNTSNRVLEIGYFGQPDGRRINKVTSITPEVQTNEKLLLVERLTVGDNSEGIINRVIPLGGGEGTAAVTLKNSTRTVADGRAIEQYTNPDGSISYYLEDADSIAEFGVYERAIQFKDQVPLENNQAAVINTANAVYDLASQHLDRKKQIEQSYGFTIKNTGQRIKPGDTLNIRYRDRVYKEIDIGVIQPVDYVDLNGDFYVKSVTDTVNMQGLSSRVEISNVDGYGENTVAEVIASTIERVEARGRVPGVTSYTYEKGYEQVLSSGDLFNAQHPPRPALFKLNMANRFTSIDSVKIIWSTFPLHTYSLGETLISTAYRVYVSDQYPSDISLWINDTDVTTQLGGPWNPDAGNEQVENEELDITDIILADGLEQIHKVEFRTAIPDVARPIGVFNSNSIMGQLSHGIVEMTVVVNGSSAAV